MSIEKEKSSTSTKDYHNKKPVYLGTFFKFKDELDLKVFSLEKKVTVVIVLFVLLLCVAVYLISTK
jgi:Ca2+/Na+ antiporter